MIERMTLKLKSFVNLVAALASNTTQGAQTSMATRFLRQNGRSLRLKGTGRLSTIVTGNVICSGSGWLLTRFCRTHQFRRLRWLQQLRKLWRGSHCRQIYGSQC